MTLQFFNRHAFHMDVKPKNWVISKKTDAAGRVKVEVLLTDIGDALDVGSPIDIRTQ